jgi:hypothetical protein
MKLALLVPDGVGVRNFMLTPFLEHIRREGEVLVWHALPSTEDLGMGGAPGARFDPLPPYRESAVALLLRQAKSWAQLFAHYEHGTTDAVMHFRRPRHAFLRSRLLALCSERLGRSFATPAGAVRLDALHQNAVGRSSQLEPFSRWLARERPDLLFCTHQRASRAVPAMLAARRLGIPTATFIFSWDNLPKDRIAVCAEHYLVWSEAMAQELLRFYPEVSPANVHTSGTPQFDLHFEPRLLETRETFLSRLKLDPERPVICFSGDDEATSPHDPLYLRDVAQSLRELPASLRPQLLFRRCPTDTGGRAATLLRDYPEIAVAPPAWRPATGDWTQVLPTREDPALLANVTAHCDVVVNLGSTMALDFALRDKPAAFLCYQPAGSHRDYSVERIYRLPHFRSVHRLEPVHWVRSKSELGGLLVALASRGDDKAAARRAWIRRLICEPLGEGAVRCARTLVRLAGQCVAENPRRANAERRHRFDSAATVSSASR